MMKPEWRNHSKGTWKYFMVRNDGSVARSLGKVFITITGGYMAQATPMPWDSEYQWCETLEEAKAWVEVVVRMEGK